MEVTNLGFFFSGWSSSESDSEEEEDESAFLLDPDEDWGLAGDGLGFSPPSSSSSLELEESEELSAFLLAPAAATGLEVGAADFFVASGSLSEEELSLLESGFFAGITFTGAFLVSSSSLESSKI